MTHRGIDGTPAAIDCVATAAVCCDCPEIAAVCNKNVDTVGEKWIPCQWIYSIHPKVFVVTRRGSKKNRILSVIFMLYHCRRRRVQRTLGQRSRVKRPLGCIFEKLRRKKKLQFYVDKKKKAMLARRRPCPRPGLASLLFWKKFIIDGDPDPLKRRRRPQLVSRTLHLFLHFPRQYTSAGGWWQRRRRWWWTRAAKTF